MTIAVVVILVLGLGLSLVIAAARDPGPTATDVAVGYASALGAGDFDALYRLTSDLGLHGQNRVAWIAERAARPREARDPNGVAARSTVVDGDHAHVEVALADTDETVGVDLVFRNRTWLVESFGMPGAPA
ncbi:MAG: hypothetical protein ABJC79_03735 [Acidimicrobiia bacterium]